MWCVLSLARTSRKRYDEEYSLYVHRSLFMTMMYRNWAVPKLTQPRVVWLIEHLPTTLWRWKSIFFKKNIFFLFFLNFFQNKLNNTRLREFIDFLPASNKDGPPRRFTDDPVDRSESCKNYLFHIQRCWCRVCVFIPLALDTLVPLDANVPYDMHEVLRKIVDDQELFVRWSIDYFCHFEC